MPERRAALVLDRRAAVGAGEADVEGFEDVGVRRRGILFLRGWGSPILAQADQI